MVNVVLFTGSSRTDPRKVREKQDGSIQQIVRPLGAYQIANLLRNKGYTVQVIDFYHWIIRETDGDLWKLVSKYVGPETLWVGWSNTFFEHAVNASIYEDPYRSPEAESIGLRTRGLEHFKKMVYERSPNCKFLVGGAKTWRWSQDTSRFFDYYVEGYADVAAIELTDYIAGKGPKPPLEINDDGSASLKYDRRGDLFDFNNSQHRWHASDHLDHGEALPIEIARGCIFRCAYCSFPLNGKKKLDFIRDPGLLRAELTENYEKYGVDHYIYSDDTHNDSVQKMELLYNEVYSKLPFKIKFSTYLRLDLLAAHPHMIELLHESGLVGTFFGIESFNNEANKTMGKGAKEEKIWDNLWKCKEVWKDDVHIHSGLILGLPNDTEETIRGWLSKAVAKDSPLDWMMIAPLEIFPNYNKDAHWLNKIELNPDFYGYSFEEDGVNWTNNVGLTKRRAQEIKWEFQEHLYANKPNVSWLTVHRAKCVGLTLPQYLDTTLDEGIALRNAKLRRYVDNLLNADDSIHRK